ncbi:LacI family DNA-binding transcriptional regulator [Paenibacillus hodogayensis]|uniref:LacI family DNA-binding transcriptional regulator n=1 Tax=Paenibacillus hodogayensis TaxID=279208 RepID=A0ABV5VYM1_9BACL
MDRKAPNDTAATPAKKITMKHIAEYLNIDRTTVSKAMASTPGVSDKTVRMVRQAAEELGYRKDIIASSLMTGKNALLGIVLADMWRGIYAPFVDSFQKSAYKNGYGVILQYVDKRTIGVRQAIEVLKQQRISGVTFISGATSEEDNPALIELAESGVAVNTTVRDLLHDRIDTIHFDNRNAGYEAAMHLIELGHRNIVFMGENRVNLTMSQRFQGYKQAVEENGLPSQLVETHENVWPKGMDVQTAYRLAKQLWTGQPKPDAIIGGNDNIALGVLFALKEEGVHVPQQVSLLGFDDLYAILAVPQLTSMRMPIMESGTTAVELLMERLNNPAKQAEAIKLAYEKIVRDSTAAAVK